MSMKAFKLVKWGQPGQYVEVPKPSPGPGDVLVRMKAAGLCRSDLDMLDSQPGSGPYANSLDEGYILGHENAGYVAEVGSAVHDLQVGEAVVTYHMRHCGNCEHCAAGAENHCGAYRRNAISAIRGCGVDGGLAEYLLVPRAEVVPIGGGDPVLYAPLTDAAVTAYHAVQTVVPRLKPGTCAAVIGIGGLGTFGVQFVKLLSPAQVIAVDTAAGRLEVARQVGADHVVVAKHNEPAAVAAAAAAEQVMSLTGGRGADAIIDFVGSASSLQLAAKISRARGRIVLVGMHGDTLEVGWGLISTGCEFAISIGSTRQDLREVCSLMGQGKLRVDVQRFSFDEVQRGYDELRAGRLDGRAVVVFP
ncbi:GroES-like protein [Biscogniauxia sp. FL1348]|nr:GroES-like protein [Biscogniauxia sp. FL1348]